MKIKITELENIPEELKMEYRALTTYSCGTIRRCVECFGKVLCVESKDLTMDESNLLMMTLSKIN